jgi:rubrerythrin
MRTSLEWREYYQQNAKSLLDIPWDAGAELTSDDRIVVAASVQGFQAGESSEGRHLYRYAEKYAYKSGDHEYLAAIKLFIAEEQRHARDLARFLRQNSIPTIKTTFADRVFRKLRHLFASLEVSIAVLITAEIIAKVYYAALKEATNSTVLRTLCDQILHDEVKHVEFQAEQLGKLRCRRNRVFQWITMAMQRFLYWGTCIVVWHFHKKAFCKSGFNFRRFWRSCWDEFNDAFAIAQQATNLTLKRTSTIKPEQNLA